MHLKINPRMALLAAAVTVLAGCATPQKFDYAAYKAHLPRSILVLPPVNRLSRSFSSFTSIMERMVLPSRSE